MVAIAVFLKHLKTWVFFSKIERWPGKILGESRNYGEVDDMSWDRWNLSCRGTLVRCGRCAPWHWDGRLLGPITALQLLPENLENGEKSGESEDCLGGSWEERKKSGKSFGNVNISRIVCIIMSIAGIAALL